MFEACLKVANTISPCSLSITGLAILSTTIFPTTAQAQIVPDSTLGDENSTVTEGAIVRGDVADLIEGGAARGGNLFHSFLEFNVNEGQRVYFANPDGIESILSRITGGNPSNIFGPLGVDGTADLFLLNPNGIVFGENAALDIEGSFYATTGNAIGLGDEVFSATEPEQSRLLTVNPSVLFANYLTGTSGDIENRGQLAVMGDLTLAGNQLNLQGQVAAAGNLTLLALDEVQIRDAAEVPFIGFAGGDLLVQGNKQVDIIALSHPNSGLYSYGNMVLRSANPVGGDAHYWSGGNFRIETLDGTAGNLYSPIDPIIRSLGDVVIDQYVGSSLHILAGGSVNIGTTIIDAPDTGAFGIDFLRETVTLSDGTVVEVDGGAQPTLDIRAGVTPAALGAPPLEVITGFDPSTDGFFGDAFVTDEPSNTDITIRDAFILAPGGQVVLTNQYQPNKDLPAGNIIILGSDFFEIGINVQSGEGLESSIAIDASGNIWSEAPIQTSSSLGNSGSVRLLSNADISLVQGSLIRANALGEGAPGNITIRAADTVSIEGPNSFVISNITSDGNGNGERIYIQASNLNLSDSALIDASTFGSGDAGQIVIDVKDAISLEAGSRIVNNIETGAVGDTGGIFIETGSISLNSDGAITSVNNGVGNSGGITIQAEEFVSLTENRANVLSPNLTSSILSVVDTEGQGSSGDILIETGDLSLSGAEISSSTFGEGDAGKITIEATGDISLDDGFIFSTIGDGGTGSSGGIDIAGDNLSLIEGSQLLSIVRSGFLDFSPGQGVAGDINIDIDGDILLSGSLIDGAPLGGIASSIAPGAEGQGGQITIQAEALSLENSAQIRSALDEGATGDAGDIDIQVLSLSLTNFAGITAATQGNGNAGDIDLQVDGGIIVDEATIISGVQGQVATGNGGSLRIVSNSLKILEGGSILASTSANGDAGEIEIQVREGITIEGSDAQEFRSNISSQVLEGAAGTGGDVIISADFISLVDGGQIAVDTQGQGDAGRVILDIENLLLVAGTTESGFLSAIRADTNGQGNAGNVDIGTNQLIIQDGGVISTTSFPNSSGTGGRVDIRASESVELIGVSQDSFSASGIYAQTRSTERGGSISITTPSLTILDGGTISTETTGSGRSGDIVIDASDTRILDGFPEAGFSSAIAAETEGEGNGGNLQIATQRLSLSGGGFVAASAREGSSGNAGTIFINATESIDIVGTTPDGEGSSGISASAEPSAAGDAGNIFLSSPRLTAQDGGGVFANNLGFGEAGSILISTSELTELLGGSSINASVGPEATGQGQELQIFTRRLDIEGGSSVITFTLGNADAADIFIQSTDSINIAGSNADGSFASQIGASSFSVDGQGEGGSIEIQTGSMNLSEGGQINALGTGFGDSGNITLLISDSLTVNDGSISTTSGRSAGGQIAITAEDIHLLSNGDILTSVFSGEGGGGNIIVVAGFVIAFDDSDILAFSQDGVGGNITLDTPAFFGENYDPEASNNDPISTLDGNNRVDINATGAISSGTISVPDVSFIENSLNELSGEIVNTATLTAGSCIARADSDRTGSFVVTGGEGLPQQPGGDTISAYPTGTVQSPAEAAATPAIQEPQGVYQLTDGRLVLSHECE